MAEDLPPPRSAVAALAAAQAAVLAYAFELARYGLLPDAPRLAPGGVPYFGRLLICAAAALVAGALVWRLARGREARWWLATRVALWPTLALFLVAILAWP